MSGSNRELIPFQLTGQPNFDDIGVATLGHLASSGGVELVAVKGIHTEATAHEMVSGGWVLHTFLTPPRGSLAVDSGPERPLPRFTFLSPGAPLVWRSSPCVASVCKLNADFLISVLDAEPGLSLDAVNCVLTQSTGRLAYLSQLMFREATTPGLGASLLTEAIGMEIALEVVRCDRRGRPDDTPMRGGLARWQMRQLDAYVNEHLADDLSLTCLARLLDVSPRHLSRVVKIEKGIGVHAWVSELRLAEAQRLLARTTVPLYEVARRVAFKNPASFSTAFRMANGLSPSEYRRLAAT